MNKQLICCIMVFLLFLTMVSGCTQPEGKQIEEEPLQTQPAPAEQTGVEQEEFGDPDQLPLMIMVDGALYVSCNVLELSVKLDDNQILGYISAVNEDQIPTQDGEGNFPAALNAPYARWSDEQYSDAVVVYFAGRWYVFVPENQVS